MFIFSVVAVLSTAWLRNIINVNKIFLGTDSAASRGSAKFFRFAWKVQSQLCLFNDKLCNHCHAASRRWQCGTSVHSLMLCHLLGYRTLHLPHLLHPHYLDTQLGVGCPILFETVAFLTRKTDPITAAILTHSAFSVPSTLFSCLHSNPLSFPLWYIQYTTYQYILLSSMVKVKVVCWEDTWEWDMMEKWLPY